MVLGQFGEPGIGLVAEPEAAAVGLQGCGEPRRERVVGGQRQRLVERLVGLDEGQHVARDHRLLHGKGGFVKQVGGLAGDEAGGRAGQHHLDAATRVEDAQPVAGMERSDGDAGARPDVEQAFPGQALDRLAHRRAAEAEAFDQRAFGDETGRRQFERHDHVLEHAIGLCRRRLGAMIYRSHQCHRAL